MYGTSKTHLVRTLSRICRECLLFSSPSIVDRFTQFVVHLSKYASKTHINLNIEQQQQQSKKNTFIKLWYCLHMVQTVSNSIIVWAIKSINRLAYSNVHPFQYGRNVCIRIIYHVNVESLCEFVWICEFADNNFIFLLANVLCIYLFL